MIRAALFVLLSLSATSAFAQDAGVVGTAPEAIAEEIPAPEPSAPERTDEPAETLTDPDEPSSVDPETLTEPDDLFVDSGYEEDPEALEDTRIRPAVLVSGSVATAALLTSAIFGILALNAESEFEDGVTNVRNADSEEARARAREDAADAASRADDFALVSDIALLGVLAAGGITAYFALTDVEVTPTASTTGAGLHVRARY